MSTHKVDKLQTMDQARATFALAEVEKCTKEQAALQAEVSRYLNNLPALIHMNGLGQAMAFYRSKGSTHERIYAMMGRWLCEAQHKGQVFEGHKDLLEAITHSDMKHYMAAQNEAQALLEWLKKFAAALLKQDANQER